MDKMFDMASSTSTVLRLFGDGKTLDSIVSPTSGLSVLTESVFVSLSQNITYYYSILIDLNNVGVCLIQK